MTPTLPGKQTRAEELRLKTPALFLIICALAARNSSLPALTPSFRLWERAVQHLDFIALSPHHHRAGPYEVQSFALASLYRPPTAYSSLEEEQERRQLRTLEASYVRLSRQAIRLGQAIDLFRPPADRSASELVRIRAAMGAFCVDHLQAMLVGNAASLPLTPSLGAMREVLISAAEPHCPDFTLIFLFDLMSLFGKAMAQLEKVSQDLAVATNALYEFEAGLGQWLAATSQLPSGPMSQESVNVLILFRQHAHSVVLVRVRAQPCACTAKYGGPTLASCHSQELCLFI